MASIFSALKQVDDTVYVTSRFQTYHQEIHNVEDIPTDVTVLDNHQDPTVSRKKVFTARIYFRANHPFFRIAAHDELKLWIRASNITLELNSILAQKLSRVFYKLSSTRKHTSQSD